MADKAKTQKKVSKLDIITFYMDHVLEHEHKPKSVYKFAKDHKIEEKDFYKYFGNFDALREEIWETFFENAHNTLYD